MSYLKKSVPVSSLLPILILSDYASLDFKRREIHIWEPVPGTKAHGADRLDGPGKAVPTGAFSSQGVLLPTPSSPAPPSTSTLCQETPCPTHCRAGWTAKASWFWEQSWWRRVLPFPGPRLTFHAHAVIKTFVVEAAVVGCAEMFPEVTATSWQHSEHM